MSRSAHEGTIGGSLRPRGPIQLALTTRSGPRETVVTVAGELDILTVPRLARTLEDIIRRRHADVVALGVVSSFAEYELERASRYPTPR